jgi:hypothetical protein
MGNIDSKSSCTDSTKNLDLPYNTPQPSAPVADELSMDPVDSISIETHSTEPKYKIEVENMINEQIKGEIMKKNKRLSPSIFYLINSNYKTSMLLKRLKDDCFLEDLSSLLLGDNRAIVDRRHVALIIYYGIITKTYILDYATNMEYLRGLELALTNNSGYLTDKQDEIIMNDMSNRVFSLKEKRYLACIINKFDSHIVIKNLIKFL